jgi:hypothetical protein
MREGGGCEARARTWGGAALEMVNERGGLLAGAQTNLINFSNVHLLITESVYEEYMSAPGTVLPAVDSGSKERDVVVTHPL